MPSVRTTFGEEGSLHMRKSERRGMYVNLSQENGGRNTMLNVRLRPRFPAFHS